MSSNTNAAPSVASPPASVPDVAALLINIGTGVAPTANTVATTANTVATTNNAIATTNNTITTTNNVTTAPTTSKAPARKRSNLAKAVSKKQSSSKASSSNKKAKRNTNQHVVAAIAKTVAARKVVHADNRKAKTLLKQKTTTKTNAIDTNEYVTLENNKLVNGAREHPSMEIDKIDRISNMFGEASKQLLNNWNVSYAAHARKSSKRNDNDIVVSASRRSSRQKSRTDSTNVANITPTSNSNNQTSSFSASRRSGDGVIFTPDTPSLGNSLFSFNSHPYNRMVVEEFMMLMPGTHVVFTIPKVLVDDPSSNWHYINCAYDSSGEIIFSKESFLIFEATVCRNISVQGGQYNALPPKHDPLANNATAFIGYSQKVLDKHLWGSDNGNIEFSFKLADTCSRNGNKEKKYQILWRTILQSKTGTMVWTYVPEMKVFYSLLTNKTNDEAATYLLQKLYNEVKCDRCRTCRLLLDKKRQEIKNINDKKRRLNKKLLNYEGINLKGAVFKDVISFIDAKFKDRISVPFREYIAPKQR